MTVPPGDEEVDQDAIASEAEAETEKKIYNLKYNIEIHFLQL